MVSRRYKAAYALHAAFKARYVEALVDTVQALPGIYSAMTYTLTKRKSLLALRARGNLKKLIRALQVVAYDVTHLSRDLARATETIGAFIEEHSKKCDELPAYPTVQALMKDLAAIEEDFVKWTYDHANNTLTVRTDTMRLAPPSGDFSVTFSGFDIVIDLDALARNIESPYRITAPKPTYPVRSGDSSLIHPHVRNAKLCEGEGVRSVDLFLSRGLFQDLIVLINQILSTYNPESPYLALAYWTEDGREPDMADDDEEDAGAHCDCCGFSTAFDDLAECASCGNGACAECGNWCKVDQRTLCDGCVVRRQRQSSPCCSSAGEADCLLWQNEPCRECDTPPCDSDKLECSWDNTVICRDCAAEVVDDPERWCDCDNLGCEDCALVAAGLPRYEERVPASCQSCEDASYRGCLVLLGETEPEGKDEQRQASEKEATEDGREPEGRPEPAVAGR